MTATIDHRSTDAPRAVAPPATWAVRVAHAVPLLLVPSGLWRLALGLGVPIGFTGSLADTFAAPGWITLYVVSLSLLAEGFALLAIGLVRPWGETIPGWVPRLGGRGIPPALVVTLATLGGLAVAVVTGAGAYLWSGPQNNGDPESPQGLAGVVMTACYAPQLLWAPFLGAVTLDFHRRHRRHAHR